MHRFSCSLSCVPVRIRLILAIAGCTAPLLGLVLPAGASEKAGNARIKVADVKVLSERGSTRATFYPQTNKIVTLDGKTHVAWLDSISETMVATYDHASGEWSPAGKVGTGFDNHGGPALTCDSEGYLHIIFGPHHGPFHHRRSAKPNAAAAWVKLPDFGHNATYPSAVFDEKDTLHIIYRGAKGKKGLTNPRKLVYQRRTKAGSWSEPRELVRAPIKSGYTHFHCELAIAPDRTLHVSFDIYCNGAAKCAGHLMSRNRGDTWTLADGSALDLPVTPESDAIFKRAEPTLRTWNVVCDSNSRPWISVQGPDGLELFHHDGKQWQIIRPTERLAAKQPSDPLAGYIPMTLDSSDRIYVMGTQAGDVVLLSSADKGRTFHHQRVFQEDAKLPHRGPNIERPTGHHRVDVPWLLFCTGEKGPDCYGKGLFNVTRAVRLAIDPQP